MRNGPDWLDEEVNCNMRLLAQGGWRAHEVAIMDRSIRDRAEYVRAGVSHPTAKYWTRKIQNEIDSRTRMRWDYKNGWTLDRWADGCWNVVGVFGFNYIREWLIDYLRERDMQRWSSPEAYLEHKRAQAFKVECANWSKGNEQLMANIDKMSDKRVKNFIQVERALHTGEKITAHGSDLTFLERQRAASNMAPALPTRQSINPGMHPRIWRRKYGRSPYAQLGVGK